MFAELAGSAGRALLNSIDFFRDEPLMKWVLGLGDRELTSLRDMIRNMKVLRVALKKNEEDAMRNFDEIAETRSLRLRRVVDSIEKEKNIIEFFRTMIKSDVRGLQDIESTINGLLRLGGYRGLKVNVESAELGERLAREKRKKKEERRKKEGRKKEEDRRKEEEGGRKAEEG